MIFFQKLTFASITKIYYNFFLPFLINNKKYNNYWFHKNFFTLEEQSNDIFFFFQRNKFFSSIWLILTWLKIRVIYYVNNWIYTTNHKRIAVNYFWFVILSGIVGMVLATVIRLELAYPGIGIFAGDSLQYLSLVSAHGVIMVFFMIMPLLFGAFANFLLPTQLGVHDVAFPRLNSAAFWFLPAGLIMLAQLVCVDRRYQRMNCFNIREVQSLFKRRFFNDLINSNDHRKLLDNTMMGLRFKTNSLNSINPNMFLFYNYGTDLNTKNRPSSYNIFSFQNIKDQNNPYKINSFNFKVISQIERVNSQLWDFFLFFIILDKDIFWNLTWYDEYIKIFINFFFFFNIVNFSNVLEEVIKLSSLYLNKILITLTYFFEQFILELNYIYLNLNLNLGNFILNYILNMYIHNFYINFANDTVINFNSQEFTNLYLKLDTLDENNLPTDSYFNDILTFVFDFKNLIIFLFKNFNLDFFREWAFRPFIWCDILSPKFEKSYFIAKSAGLIPNNYIFPSEFRFLFFVVDLKEEIKRLSSVLNGYWTWFRIWVDAIMEIIDNAFDYFFITILPLILAAFDKKFKEFICWCRQGVTWESIVNWFKNELFNLKCDLCLFIWLKETCVILLKETCEFLWREVCEFSLNFSKIEYFNAFKLPKYEYSTSYINFLFPIENACAAYLLISRLYSINDNYLILPTPILNLVDKFYIAPSPLLSAFYQIYVCYRVSQFSIFFDIREFYPSPLWHNSMPYLFTIKDVISWNYEFLNYYFVEFFIKNEKFWILNHQLADHSARYKAFIVLICDPIVRDTFQGIKFNLPIILNDTFFNDNSFFFKIKFPAFSTLFKNDIKSLFDKSQNKEEFFSLFLLKLWVDVLLLLDTLSNCYFFVYNKLLIVFFFFFNLEYLHILDEFIWNSFNVEVINFLIFDLTWKEKTDLLHFVIISNLIPNIAIKKNYEDFSGFRNFFDNFLFHYVYIYTSVFSKATTQYDLFIETTLNHVWVKVIVNELFEQFLFFLIKFYLFLIQIELSDLLNFFTDVFWLLKFPYFQLIGNKNYFIFETENFLILKSNFKIFYFDTILIYKYISSYFTIVDSFIQNRYKNEELSSYSPRYHRFDNPIFSYDYKVGNYFPQTSKLIYNQVILTFLHITGGLRVPAWFFSENFDELFFKNFNNFFDNSPNLISMDSPLHTWTGKFFFGTNSFYNFFFITDNKDFFLNQRWIAVNALYNKFNKMFFTSSMQQRIYTNWRQLKFTRESWRCKLLAARHQKTLYKRYLDEDSLIWSIERNVRDLIPGWAMITPFSNRIRYTAVGKTDIGLMGVLLVLNSSIISAANFLVTYRYLSTLNNRKMRDTRSFFTEGIMVASWMMIFANPMLVIGIIMLLSDRHWQTSFFDYSGGGDTVLFQHMFWFFGHPEVYIIVIPTFGFTNTILSYYLKKRISARASLMYSMYTIAFLGFFVWGHHMYMVGLAHTTRMLFSTLTVMISVPAATKLMHWCVTLVNSALTIELPLVCIFTFVFFFVSGGISGMCVANTGMDVLFHDTFYVIGHFHVMLAGAAMIASFGAFYFYFTAIFGVKYSRLYAYLHYVYYLFGQLFTVIPMMWLGYAGMPRRVLDYPTSLGGWHSIISGGHMLSVAGLIAFFIMIFDSLRQSKAVIRNYLGVSRYNTRINFYIYEIARSKRVVGKSWALYRYNDICSLKLNGLPYENLEEYETTLFSYTFSKINISYEQILQIEKDNVKGPKENLRKYRKFRIYEENEPWKPINVWEENQGLVKTAWCFESWAKRRSDRVDWLKSQEKNQKK